MAQAFDSTDGVVSYPGDRDKLPRSTMLTRLRIDNRMPWQQAGSHLLPLGVSEIEVKTNELPGILGDAWDSHEKARIDAARESLEKRIDQELIDHVSAVDGGPRLSLKELQLKLAEVLAKGEGDRSKKDRELLDARDDRYAQTNHSIESIFHADHDRGIRPFKSVEIIKEDIPLPDEEQDTKRETAVVEALVLRLQEVSNSGNESKIMERLDALASQLATVQSENAELKLRIGGGGNKAKHGRG